MTGSIALTVAGCSSPSKVTVTTAPATDSPNAPETSTATQPFDAKSAAALVPQVSAPENIPGLVQATNGDERARQVQKIIDSEKRQDPFAAVPVTLQQSIPLPDRTVIPFNRPTVSAPSPTLFPAPIPRQTKIRRRTPAPKVAYYPYSPPVKPLSVKNKPSITVPPRQPVTTQVKQNSPVIAVLPPLPSAALANAVEVSGVVVVGKVTQVIVKAPNEVSSRHVQTGQRLSNGQILVKRVEMSDGAEPIVILEENGIEVAKTIGVLIQAANPV
ncbi:hypothetical protein [Stenomitos frigidus]|uniref:Uncharacterized protein n=1 Tax=Stenomitos frigidus ULC18 TaxID=2107698 RepID=A0A2T1EBT6_9CYAN|nr:hypothetical protein [Stenomitos frigidus]PSB30155.1 hypothetical protein C7B82_09365 [Stenomitos frigidus ULC18]